MINWRKPVLKAYETWYKRNHIYACVETLLDFYERPLGEQLAIQEQRLIDLLKHAAVHVPYYNRILRQVGVVSPTGNIDLSLFRDLPLLTKSILKTQFEELKSDDLADRDWYKNTSGGSTGEPVAVLQDRLYSDYALATSMFFYKIEYGYEVGEPLMKLWGSQRDILQGGEGAKGHLINFLRNRTIINAFRMNEDDMINCIQTIQRSRASVLIDAYADAIYELARFVNRQKLNVTNVKAVLSSAGTLHPFMRSEIENAFQCHVYNRYGSRELGGIAFETYDHSAIQIGLYTHIVEIIDENGQACPIGQAGEVVVTSLTNYSMPLIRYRVGDRAVAQKRSQEVIPAVSAIQDLTGRVTESFVKQDGSLISGLFFIHFLGVVHNSGWIRKFQIIQEDYNLIKIKLVTNEEFDQSALREIEHSIHAVMGETCAVHFDLVDEIAPLPSGKYCYTKSLLKT